VQEKDLPFYAVQARLVLLKHKKQLQQYRVINQAQPSPISIVHSG
jgi:hypothetical protein